MTTGPDPRWPSFRYGRITPSLANEIMTTAAAEVTALASEEAETTVETTATAIAAPAVAPDPAAKLSTLAAEIQRLQTRRAELHGNLKTATAELTSSKSTVGYMIANNFEDRAIVRTRERVATLQVDVDGTTAAIAIIERSLAWTQQKHARLELEIAGAALSTARRAAGEALKAIDDGLRAFARGELAQLVHVQRTAAANAERQWIDLQDIKRRAGLPADGPEQSPNDRRWTSYPDLRTAVDELEKYADGRTVLQSLTNASVREATARGR